jgi:hypothetical protein
MFLILFIQIWNKRMRIKVIENLILDKDEKKEIALSELE